MYTNILHTQQLVGGFNPSEKYARQNGFIFPTFRGENTKKYLSCHHLDNLSLIPPEEGILHSWNPTLGSPQLHTSANTEFSSRFSERRPP